MGPDHARTRGRICSLVLIGPTGVQAHPRMHLEASTPASVIDDGEMWPAISGQGHRRHLVVLSVTADSDLKPCSEAAYFLQNCRRGFLTVRLTNLLALGHPASVDLYVERTLRDVRKDRRVADAGRRELLAPWGRNPAQRRVAARRVVCHLHSRRNQLEPGAGGAVVRSKSEHTHALWRYCLEGGEDNAQLRIALCRAL